MNLLADASLPGLAEAFPKPFHLTCYNKPEEIAHLLPGQEILLCRSTLKVNQALLKNHSLLYVATASSGTDHLDHQWLKSQKIQIIDAKGSNAEAVADYVVACLAYLEQQKLLSGKTAGIIGYGKVGAQVAARLSAHQLDTIIYDPLKAKLEKSFHSCKLEELQQVDLLCIHAELHHTQPFPSNNLINNAFLQQLKPGCIIINAARGGIVNEHDLLNMQKPLVYCTDVYLNEPAIDRRIVDRALLCTPHIAGHSLEAKYGAVAMVSEQLHQIAGLPLPQYATPPVPTSLSIKKNTPWYEAILDIYNPLEETQRLKEANEKESTFLKLRKNHQKRHDFSRLPHHNLTNKT